MNGLKSFFISDYFGINDGKLGIMNGRREMKGQDGIVGQGGGFRLDGRIEKWVVRGQGWRGVVWFGLWIGEV